MDRISDDNRKSDLYILFFIFAAFAAVRFFLFDYVKTIAVFPDETRYYSIARSLAFGQGISIRGVANDFQKIAYPLVISPAFFIQDQILRIRMITLINSLVLTLSIFPVWGISKELKIGRGARYILVFITLIWPDMMYADSFMSEVLYLPLMLTFVYVWLKCRRPDDAGGQGSGISKIAGAVILGIMMMIGYLTKEIFLAVPISLFLTDFVRLGIYKEKTSGGHTDIFTRNNIITPICSLVVFVLLFITLKLTIFHGMGNSYDQQSIDAILSVHNFLYMLYAFIYYLAAIIIGSYLLPIILPAALYSCEETEDKTKDLYRFTLWWWAISCAVIAYTISVREDLGSISPKLHMRYLGTGFILLAIVCASMLQKIHPKKAFTQKRIMLITCLGTVATIFLIIVFRQMPAGSFIDEYTLEYFRAMTDRLPSSGTAAAIIILFLTSAVWVMTARLTDKRSLCVAIMIICVTFGSIICDFHATIVRAYYGAEKSIVGNAMDIDAYIDMHADRIKHVLYITDPAGQYKLDKYMDTYMDNTDKICYSDPSLITGLTPGSATNVSALEIIEPAWKVRYEGVDSIELIIVDNTFEPGVISLDTDSIKILDELSGGAFSVYENLTPAQIGGTD